MGGGEELINSSFLLTDEICEVLAKRGLKHSVVLTRRAHNEKLSVLKFHKH